MPSTKAILAKWRAGHEAAARRQRVLAQAEGADPPHAIALYLDGLDTLGAMGLWPGARDPASERLVVAVRKMWARLQEHAKRARSR